MDDLTQEFIAESMDGLDRMERCLTELEQKPQDGELLSEIFRAVHTIKGATGFLGFTRLEKLAHAGENLLGALREGKLSVTDELITGLLRLLDGLRSILNLIAKTGGEGTRAADEDSALIALLVALNRPTVAAVAAQEHEAIAAAVAATESMDHLMLSNSAAADKTLRIDVEVLNRMMNLVGELVLTRNQVLQSSVGAANFAELARRLDSVTADLRETVMQARMQPVGNLFGKFPRLVRDLARTCGKSVKIELQGQETALDKSLLEAIKDPLTHMMRNSVDHGIETPEARRLAGKPEEGQVRLRAFQQSGSVVIEVSDDGGGIRVERVLEKAVERGLVTQERAAEMTEREALQLIFLPGFSTAAAVTKVSGRGVGMDVVRSNVEKVGGSVEVESKPGLGTTMRLRVPLTLAIVPALVVRSGGQSFALPQSSLVELVYVPSREVAHKVEKMGAAELYRMRGRLVPLIWLERLLGLPKVLEQEHGMYIAVLEAEGCRFALVVDDLLAPEEIVVKPLSPVLREIGLFSGATVLGSGALALILDVAAAAHRAGVKQTEETAVAEAEEESGVEEDREQFLVIEERRRERTALPLALVERIESVPVEKVEYAQGRMLLQHEGELLPLEDEGGVLAELEERCEGEATVLICESDGEGERGAKRRIGLVVRRVVDVAAGFPAETPAELAGARDEIELTMVKEKLATVRRLRPRNSGANWRDVA